MKKDKIIQFVFFETDGNTDEFIYQWDQYVKEMGDDQVIRLQQEVGNKKRTRYLSQHWCEEDEFKFIFKKDRRSAHFPEVEMRVRQLGGYTAVQVQCDHESAEDESKIFVFVTNGADSLAEWRRFSHYRFLNIYQAYFENSNYDFILEFFVDNVQAEKILEHLKTERQNSESGMFKECVLHRV